ncbi:MAG: class I SAM-dependent methyltransferase [Rubripirellula sp.]
MNSSSDTLPKIIRHIEAGEICCDPEWEAAYERFETPEEEIQKFVGRLNAFGLNEASKDIRMVELFCGRGGGLHALSQLGLTNVEGVDLSESLLQKYRGPATLHLADCRELPFENDSFDAAIVQGGLHHLPTLPEDLDAVLAEVSRIVKPTGRFYVVEPWSTPFLTFVHFVVEQPWMRKIYAKGDALAAMTDHERVTYEQWLGQPESILQSIQRFFEVDQLETTWGKLRLIAKPK